MVKRVKCETTGNDGFNNVITWKHESFSENKFNSWKPKQQ